VHQFSNFRRFLVPVGVTGAAALGAVLQAPDARSQGAIRRVEQQSNTTVRLTAVSAPMPNVAWVAGNNGTFLRTTDVGHTWTAGTVPGAERLDFRDVHAVDASTAYLLAAGSGAQSRIFKTTDGGATWRLQYTNPDSAGFYDCLDFFNPSQGLVIGDAIGEEMALLSTTDSGTRWARVAPMSLPPPMPGEASFASSGTCLTVRPNGRAWIGTTKGRVLRSTDFGRTWRPSLTPITVNDSTGVSSVAFRDNNNGMAFGGYGAAEGDVLLAVTTDGGASWTARARPLARSGVYAGAWVRDAGMPTAVAVGPKGIAFSRDMGLTWTQIDTLGYWGLGFAPGNRGWAVGGNGRIVRLEGF
jgi:photosystem II stability/assembly factor-like uncharacterized protein